nr:MAG TPA_asm: hypothetical protein [Caudoviricetes sp.]
MELSKIVQRLCKWPTNLCYYDSVEVESEKRTR